MPDPLPQDRSMKLLKRLSHYSSALSRLAFEDFDDVAKASSPIFRSVIRCDTALVMVQSLQERVSNHAWVIRAGQLSRLASDSDYGAVIDSLWNLSKTARLLPIDDLPDTAIELLQLTDDCLVCPIYVLDDGVEKRAGFVLVSGGLLADNVESDLTAIELVGGLVGGTLSSTYARQNLHRANSKLEQVNNELEQEVEKRTKKLAHTIENLSLAVSRRVRTESELRDAQQCLIDAARLAGRAEVATGVLHSVGNILTSINVSTTLIRDAVENSHIGKLQQALALMEQHQNDLADYISSDERGKSLPGYLIAVGPQLALEQMNLIDNIDTLTVHVNHIRATISAQQSYSRTSGAFQCVSLTELLDEAITLQFGIENSQRVRVNRDYCDLPEINVDKHRLLDIIVTLLSNAKDAISACNYRNPQITLRSLALDDGFLSIEVIDNGVGMSAGDLKRLFSHGFTTKKHGHGFGLHWASLAAREMDGSISADSDGPDCGSTFTVTIPIAAATETAVVAGDDGLLVISDDTPVNACLNCSKL